MKAIKVAVLVVIALMILSSIAIFPNDNNNEHTSRNPASKIAYSSGSNTIASVPINSNPSPFAYSPSAYNSAYNYNENPEIAQTDIQINSIINHNGAYVLGGENSTQSPLLLLYNTSGKNMQVLSAKVSSSIKYIDAMASEGDLIAFGGMPASGNGQDFPVDIMNLSTGNIISLSTVFPYFNSVPNIYSMDFMGNNLFMGGYFQEAAQNGYLVEYNLSTGSITNLTALMPQGTTMINVVMGYGSTLYVAGNAQNPTSFVQIFNISTGSESVYPLPSCVYGISSGYVLNGSLFLGGGTDQGGALFLVTQYGSITNYSSKFQNVAQINSLGIMNNQLFVGGWELNSSFASLFNYKQGTISTNLSLYGGFATMGSNILSMAANSTGILIGGTVSSQFTNYSGGLLASISDSYVFQNLSGLLQKTYTQYNYDNPLKQNFYIYAKENVILPGSNLTILGQGLPSNSNYELLFLNQTVHVTVNSSGEFCSTYFVSASQSPGDYLITLENSTTTYYNYFAVAYKFNKMIHGAQYPQASKYIPFSNLKYGSVVLDGNYLEFFRIANGTFPYTSLNYQVEWNQILFENLTSNGWTVAPLNQLDYASQYSINPLNYQYSPWTDYGISKVTQSGQFTNYPSQNSYFYLSGDTMIVWVPYSIVNETHFYWSMDTDYVQNSPVYNPAYRVEIGQGCISYFQANLTPSISYGSDVPVKFIESGLPPNSGWQVNIINDSGPTPIYYQNFTSNQNYILSYLPHGSYRYVVMSSDSMYVTQDAAGLFQVSGSNITFDVNFTISPVALNHQFLTNISANSVEIFNVTPTTMGPTAINFAVMNSTLNVNITEGSTSILNETIAGPTLELDVINRSDNYGYINFDANGLPVTIIVKNELGLTGYFTYNLWNYYISKYTASLATLPPQFSENLNPNANCPLANNNTGLSFTFVAPYYQQPVALALWVGEGFSNPVTGKEWWAQIGFNNWLTGMNDVSYAGWGIFSNIFGSPGGTDGAFPLIPNETYNITMEAMGNGIWGFFANGKPIIEPGLDGFFNTTSNYANGGVTMGFEVLTSARAGSPNSTSMLSTPVKILHAMSMRVDGKWIQVDTYSFNNVGENWYTMPGQPGAMGMNLWNIQGNIQNKSIPPGEIIFGNAKEPLFNIPSYANDTAYPLFGNFSYPYQNVTSHGIFVNITELPNGSLFIKPRYAQVVVSLLEFKNNSEVLENFSNYIISQPIIITNPYFGLREAITAALPNDTAWEYGGNFQEAVLVGATGSSYQIQYVQSGLPGGVTWYVNLSDGMNSGPIKGTSYTFYMPNGTYSSSIATSDKIYMPSYTSSFTVNGSPLTIRVNFTEIRYDVTIGEVGLSSGTEWNLSFAGVTYALRNTSYTFLLPNGSYFYSVSPEYGYTVTQNGQLNVSGKSLVIDVDFIKNATVYVSVLPASAILTVNGNVDKLSSGSVILSLSPGKYFIEASQAGYYSYSNLFSFGSSTTYYINISLVRLAIFGYLTGTLSPGSALLSANGILIPVTNGSFNQTLYPGEYLVSASANGYISRTYEVNITANNVTRLSIDLASALKTYTISGKIRPGDASIMFNENVAFVNQTGYYIISLPSGSYMVSVASAGYYSISEEVILSSNTELNFTLIKLPAATSSRTVSNTSVQGYNVTISSVTLGNGIVSITYSSNTNGTIVVSVPYTDLKNVTFIDILSSSVYVNGSRYSNFTVTYSMYNGSFKVILTVYGLSGDPTLVWAYSPSYRPPPSSSVPSNSSFPYIIAGVVAIIIVLGFAFVRRKR